MGVECLQITASSLIQAHEQGESQTDTHPALTRALISGKQSKFVETGGGAGSTAGGELLVGV